MQLTPHLQSGYLHILHGGTTTTTTTTTSTSTPFIFLFQYITTCHGILHNNLKKQTNTLNSRWKQLAAAFCATIDANSIFSRPTLQAN